MSSLEEFLASHGIDSSIYEQAQNLPRYIRLNPRREARAALDSLKEDLGVTPEPVPWLAGFYSLPGAASVASTRAYRGAAVYGIDAASGAAVAALAPRPGEHVLELCSAPGGKLCMIADILGGEGSATGVDDSEERASACRTVLRKYGAPGCRLFRGDATTFAAPPPSPGGGQEGHLSSGPQRKRNRQRLGHVALWDTVPRTTWGAAVPWREAEPQAPDPAKDPSAATPLPGKRSPGGEEPGGPLYDRALVDAECTHDGSFRHMAKHRRRDWSEFQEKFLSRQSELRSLQRGLLKQAFRLLRPGGVLVYCTCSLTRSQNEEVVEWFLKSEEGRASAVPIEGADLWPCRPGGIEHSVRFDPPTSNTSALFICKMVKCI
uniref:Multisite-specific trna:(Cytosine-c )-methyltransferase trm4b-like n=1 Tax=Tetraselmis sp. GSL018 TaxID=582737 RepID=A0A061RDC7_9CHLO|eukprot:CAMPEP_0177582854 /NCGR_PEP_ID=MMETSP0419_2-20121207/2993_1 /TAXON_ID=582737 /ORGANISM="Tetraselmis sp., Strain GSL018" /LENGTH=376 /DNA_ID=CAMNT_0019072171 /DNA_START=282 /DNA_END=1412 /DNA_ORIENTATION=+